MAWVSCIGGKCLHPQLALWSLKPFLKTNCIKIHSSPFHGILLAWVNEFSVHCGLKSVEAQKSIRDVGSDLQEVTGVSESQTLTCWTARYSSQSHAEKVWQD